MLRRFSIERVPLGWRLAVLVAAPLLVIAVAAADRLVILWGDRQESEIFVERMETASSIDVAIAALQQERELTARFLARPDPLVSPAETRAMLEAARVESDAAIAAAGLSSEVPPFDLETFVRPWDVEARPELKTIADLRTVVDRRVLSPADAIFVYSTIVYTYIDALNDAVSVDEVGAPPGELLAYTASLASAEAFIQARAWGTVLIQASDADAREWLLVASLAHTEDFFLGQVRSAQGPGHPHPAVDQLLNAPPSRTADDLRWAVIGAGGIDVGISATRWQEGTQPRVDAINEATSLIRAHLIGEARASVASAEREFVTIAGLGVLLIGFVAVGAWRVSRSIARPLERLAVGAHDASMGRLTPVDVPRSNDAIGEIGVAYDELNEYLHDVADAAEGIARGDLTREIVPRSSEDRLGIALQSMTRRLASMLVRSLRRSEVLEETVGELQETAARDSLTGLLNRARFEELVEGAVASAQATKSQFGLLFIDLDGFKPVNDRLGHAAGDELLRQVASRLLGGLRVDDAVARLGGDEFTVLVTNGYDNVAIDALAHQIVDLVGAPYFVHGETVEVRASVGFAHYPEHGSSVTQLLRAADEAMYAAKRAGGNEAHVAKAHRAA